MQTQEQLQSSRARARAEAVKQINKACQLQDFGTTTAELNGDTWPVKIQQQAGERFLVSGRSTGLEVYVTNSAFGYLVAVTNYQRAGIVPADVDGSGIQQYVGIENLVDATTVAAAVRWIIQKNLQFIITT